MTERAFTKCYDDIMRIKTGRNGITHTMKLVYCRLLRFTENNKEAFPTNTYLANEFGVSVRNVIDAKNDLELIGVIKQEHRFNNSNVYKIFPWTDKTPTPKQMKEGENFAPLEPELVDNTDDDVQDLHEGMKSLHGGSEKFACLEVQSLHSNRQGNIQLNRQSNKQEDNVEVVSIVTSHTEELEESSKSVSLPLSESVPSIVTSSLRRYTIKDLPNPIAFAKYDASSGYKQMYPNDLSKRIENYLTVVLPALETA